ncbi:LamG domain-containing protein [Bythopirellula polymerisocia]|uniref:LamG-like jellyroll fold domain-containing protein n=1 Tax=Bythopirellula polymerisocia TaxID=2528003 RepID=A0A5C6CB93_9BACT|nr:LamG domain-containing protein [Bythopirellula polymerisocia]TWU21355.1 hypothetical protein Pla144_45750 [Bythopirellula polymerisocia]
MSYSSITQNRILRASVFWFTCTSACLVLGFSAAQGQVTPGADLEFNAALNPVDGTDLWYPNIDTMPFLASVEDPGNLSIPREYVFFNQTQSFSTVSDSAFPGITGSYSKGGSGRARHVGAQDGPGDTDNPVGWFLAPGDPVAPRDTEGTFEIWFKNNSLTGGDQVIAEWGGGSRGAYFSLVNDSLSFYVNGNANDSNNIGLSTTLTTAGWHQVVGIYHNVDFDTRSAVGDDYISLYVDGGFIADTSATPVSIDRWSGGNAWGVGEIGVSNQPMAAERAELGPLTGGGAATDPNREALDGDIAIVRYYFDQVLTPAEVLANYEAVTSGPSADVDHDGDVDGADFLEIQRTDPSLIGLWQSQYGAGPLVSASAVPEPGTCLLLACSALLCTFVSGRSKR